ncbi:hypothetical protein [Acinetobacter sp.]|uniref:hypothetical protein n=1 Tax=Acinetobacter sp. TaxID=472 RepID=UPI0031CE7C2C
MRLFALIICGASLPLIACTQTNPLLTEKADMVGYWENPQHKLIILKDGQLKYIETEHQEVKTASLAEQSNYQSEIEAPITQLDNQHIQVGTGDFATSFKINKLPYQEQGKWKMIINGQIYIKH